MKELKPALMLTLLYVVFAGGVFPAVVWVGGQALFHNQADGSFVYDEQGKAVGSLLIAQGFSAPKYFHPRPSAAGNGYDATSSGGTNLGPVSQKLIEGAKDDPSTPNVDESFTGIRDLAQAYRTENSLAADAKLPADAVTRSGSGLDPEISPANALLQVSRVAAARGVSVEAVNALVHQSIEERFLGLWGEPRVNVLKLNLALDQAQKS